MICETLAGNASQLNASPTQCVQLRTSTSAAAAMGSDKLTGAIAKALEQVPGSYQAAITVQTAARGRLARAHAAKAAEQELLFLGMKEQVARHA